MALIINSRIYLNKFVLIHTERTLKKKASKYFAADGSHRAYVSKKAKTQSTFYRRVRDWFPGSG